MLIRERRAALLILSVVLMGAPIVAAQQARHSAGTQPVAIVVDTDAGPDDLMALA